MPELDLAIVTSSHNYGRYLGEWADSLLALTRRPAVVALVENGSTDDHSRTQLERAAAKLERAGFAVRVQLLPRAVDFGTARNHAVALAGAHEWVMHFDADDKLMPHALEDVAALAPHADIVALGYERCGDLAAGPRQRVKLYKSSAGPTLLANLTPCSGVSPFRRQLWERAPYRTDMPGGWDTALWLGFGHLGARVRPTTRPCFWYRQHADSVFNVRRLATWAGERTGHRLRGLRAGWAGVSLIVPRSREDTAERVAAWAWLRRGWATWCPGWEIVEGTAPRAEWVKGAAIADALTRAHGEILVLLDADCWVPPDTLRAAVEAVRTGRAPWVVPHGQVHRLTRQGTAQVLARDPTTTALGLPVGGRERPAYMGFAGGGCVVVNRGDYEATGGIPRWFVGWGAEDEALAAILDTLLGPHVRLAAPLLHLWHPPQETRLHSPAYRANSQRLRRVLQAKGDVAAMWALVRGQAMTHFTGVGRAARLQPLRRREVGAGAQAPVTADPFAARRLARARARQEAAQLAEAQMAGARDVVLQHRKAMREQATRNRAAVLEKEAARQEAWRRSQLPLEERKRLERKQAAPHADKMDRGEQAADKGSGVTLPPSSELLAGIRFDTLDAHTFAVDARLTAAAFAGREPKGPAGFTLAQVRTYAQLAARKADTP